MIKKRILSLWISLCVICIAGAQEKELAYCNRQIHKTLKAIGTSSKLPRAIEAGKSSWNMVSPHDWTSGFFPGVLWYDYEYSHEPEIKEKAVHFTKLLESLSSKVTSHDMGFQMFCSYGHAYRLTKENYYKDILLKSADELAKLYNPRVGTLLSWPWKVKESNWPHNTIIDNMMNLELLFWAAKHGGGKRLYDIALSHARVTKANHFRTDGSCYHVAVYDTITGKLIKGITHQGYNDASMWARGQAWAVYGYTMVYRETRDKEYLRFAEKVADLYIRRLPADLIPYWDFDAPDIPTAPRDASAAAVVASALLELSTLEDDKERADKYYKLAEKMLRNLSTKKYQSRDKNPALLLHSTGHYPADDEIDASIIYADYYYIEALMRWKKIRAGQSLSEANKFMHPGILHTKESLERMKYYVDHRIEPAYSSYRLLEADSCALSTYQMQGPFEVIARLGVNKHTKRPSEDDHKAAYLNALMWTLTGDEAHARKSIEILNAYSTTLKLIGPNDNDDPLCASLQGSMLANAAELIKHTYSKVTPAEIAGWEKMLRTVFIPVLDTFFKAKPYTNGNWGAAATKAYMAFGIFLEDEALYNQAVHFYYNGHDNGTIKNYIGENGQCQESGRDQDHVMFGLGNLAEACETAYNQGDEKMYAALDNRLLTGYEYTAKYNLGESVPFTTWTDISGRYCNWQIISDKLRGVFRPIYEIVYNHYVTRKGLDMPYTRRVLSKMSVEGASKWCDGPGYGTLFFRTDMDDDYIRYADPFVGTSDNGHTFPGACVPFGFIQASPETGNDEWKYCSGYNFADDSLIGFAQTHLSGTGCPDLGDVLLLPFSGEVKDGVYRSKFDKKSEKASPGYYAVRLTDAAVDVELTSTQRTSFHRYVYHSTAPAHLLVDLQNGIVWDKERLKTHVLSAEMDMPDNHTITGHQVVENWVKRQYYYVISFDKPYVVREVLSSAGGEKAKRLILDFDLAEGDTLQVKIALSSVCLEGAKAALAKENPGWDFDKIRMEACRQWNYLFDRVKVTGSDEQKKNFYTSLYHLFIQPNDMADTDGRYRGADDKVYTSKTGSYYSTLSLWDTYRATHPLYTILSPERVDGMIQSMLEHYRTMGYLPIWALWGKEAHCMIGNHAIPVIVDAYLKGFRGFDVEEAYAAIRGSSTVSHQHSDWEVYDRYGYYPFDIIPKESVSRTLESTYDDYCVARMAKSLGKEKDYAYFSRRASYYKNLLDPSTTMMRGKDSKGKWRTPFNTFLLSHAATSGGDYTEGNAWQYTWHVQHDVEGLIDLFGGKEKFANKLDSLFFLESSAENTGFTQDVTGLIGQYAHGNEPSHHVAYLYNYAGQPYKTQQLIREIFDRFYLPKPDGLCGNDDCGQMSAWYIFSAMGFYPVNPIGGEYILGAPQVEEVTISLPNDKTFTMQAKGLSHENKYVKSVTWNGKPVENFRIHHSEIMKGGELVFVMTDKY